MQNMSYIGRMVLLTSFLNFDIILISTEIQLYVSLKLGNVQLTVRITTRQNEKKKNEKAKGEEKQKLNS